MGTQGIQGNSFRLLKDHQFIWLNNEPLLSPSQERRSGGGREGEALSDSGSSLMIVFSHVLQLLVILLSLFREGDMTLVGLKQLHGSSSQCPVSGLSHSFWERN